MAKLLGLNHVALVCTDMDRTANFYVNILGMKLKATGQESVALGKHPFETLHKIKRIYFFQMEDGSCLTFIELPAGGQPESSLFTPNYWPSSPNRPLVPSKVDHLAFNVSNREELVWYQSRLREHGIEVSEIYERAESPKFVKSIYFLDPDNNPLEIATWDHGAPEWEAHKSDNYMKDPDLVPSMLNR